MGGRRETFVLTREGGQAIIEEWSRRNIEGGFDRDHDFGDLRGTFDIELRADGLWVCSIQWSAETLLKFKEKKLRYYSPAFDVAYDEQGREIRDDKQRLQIVALINIALTNYPATDNLRPLIALSVRALHRRYTNMEPLSLEQLQAKAQEMIDTFSAKGDLTDMMKWLDKLIRGEGAPAVPEGEEMPAEGEAMTADPIAVEATAIAEAAYTVTGLRQPKEVIGALRQFGTVLKERDNAVAELRQVKHSIFVDECLKAGKITPAEKADALKEDPATFRGAMKWAQPRIDVEAITARTRTTAQPGPTAEELENDPKLVAYCNRAGTDAKAFAANWHRNYPGIPFEG